MARTEARAGTVGGAAVIGNSDECDVEFGCVCNVGKTHERGDSREAREGSERRQLSGVEASASFSGAS